MLKRFASAVSAAALGLALLPAMLPQQAMAQSSSATPAFPPQRLVPIPHRARRADMTFNGTENVLIDGKRPARLAPGVRIFSRQNMLLMYGNLTGTAKVKFLRERTTGLLMNIWVLTEDEIAASDPKPDPTDPETAK